MSFASFFFLHRIRSSFRFSKLFLLSWQLTLRSHLRSTIQTFGQTDAKQLTWLHHLFLRFMRCEFFLHLNIESPMVHILTGSCGLRHVNAPAGSVQFYDATFTYLIIYFISIFSICSKIAHENYDRPHYSMSDICHSLNGMPINCCVQSVNRYQKQFIFQNRTTEFHIL